MVLQIIPAEVSLSNYTVGTMTSFSSRFPRQSLQPKLAALCATLPTQRYATVRSKFFFLF